MRENGFRLVGHGVYTISEASRLTRIPAARMRRWLQGYNYRIDGEPRRLRQASPTLPASP